MYVCIYVFELLLLSICVNMYVCMYVSVMVFYARCMVYVSIFYCSEWQNRQPDRQTDTAGGICVRCCRHRGVTGLPPALGSHRRQAAVTTIVQYKFMVNCVFVVVSACCFCFLLLFLFCCWQVQIQSGAVSQLKVCNCVCMCVCLLLCVVSSNRTTSHWQRALCKCLLLTVS